MGILSGNVSVIANGTGTPLSTARTWSVNPTVTMASGVASGTKGAPVLTPAISDFTGTVTGYGPQPPILPGSAFSFRGYTGVASPGDGYTGASIAESVTISANPDTADYIEWTMNFAGNGALSRGVEFTETQDASTQTMQTSKALKVEYNSVEIAPVLNWSITLTRVLQPYTNASGVIQRVASLYTATATWAALEADSGAIPTEGLIKAAKFYTDASNYWDFQYGALTTNPATFDIEGGTLSGYTASLEWSTRDDGGTHDGTIVAPDSTVWFAQ